MAVTLRFGKGSMTHGCHPGPCEGVAQRNYLELRLIESLEESIQVVVSFEVDHLDALNSILIWCGS